MQKRARSGFSAPQEGQSRPAAISPLNDTRYSHASRRPPPRRRPSCTGFATCFVVSLLPARGALAIAACGGGARQQRRGSRSGPRATFDNDQAIQSGVFDLSASRSTPRAATSRASVDITLGGPFQGQGDGLPKFDVNANVNADTSQGDCRLLRRADLHRRFGLRQLPGHRLRGPAGALRPVRDHLHQARGEEQPPGQSGNFLKRLGIDRPTG